MIHKSNRRLTVLMLIAAGIAIASTVLVGTPQEAKGAPAHEDGANGIVALVQRAFSFSPDYFQTLEPGTQNVYHHYLENTGDLTDTYELSLSSSQGWGETVLLSPITLPPAGWVQIPVTVTVPADDGVRGLTELTIVTATSGLEPPLTAIVVDQTLVPHRIYLPLVLKN